MKASFWIYLMLFALIRDNQSPHVEGEYFKCSVECLHIKKIRIAKDGEVYTKSRMERYESDWSLGGDWQTPTDSTIILKLRVKEKRNIKEVITEYVLKEHAGLKFLVPLTDEQEWPVMTIKMDSMYEHDEGFFLLNNRNFASEDEKIKAFDKLKKDVYSQVFYRERPVKGIYIGDK